MGFGTLMFLREPANHIDGCYFCSINVTGINKKEAQIFELQKLSYRSLSYRSLKCVLLHITNVYGSIPIGHSTTLQEKYDAIKSVLQHIKYKDMICIDLKMVNFELGQQSDYMKYPWFL